jgi:hypothetical protein
MLSQYFDGDFERRSMGYEGSDVLCSEGFRWAPEVKDDKSVKLKHLWKPTKKLLSYWEQAVFQAKILNKVPLLCIKLEGLWFAFSHEESHLNFPLYAWLLEEWCISHGNNK